MADLMIWIFMRINDFFNPFFPSKFRLFDKYLTVSWHFWVFCLFYIKSVHWVQIGLAQGPCWVFFFLLLFCRISFSRPLSFPVTQSYLISWTATREEEPGVLMLIRAVGRQLAGLEEPERRQETRSDAVTENLLWQPQRCEGNKCEFASKVTLRSVGCQEGF